MKRSAKFFEARSIGSQIMFQWFIHEQIEEEATFSQLLAELKLVEGDGRGLLMLDRELAGRAFTPPV